jgi:hypothetical protein
LYEVGKVARLRRVAAAAAAHEVIKWDSDCAGFSDAGNHGPFHARMRPAFEKRQQNSLPRCERAIIESQ